MPEAQPRHDARLATLPPGARLLSLHPGVFERAHYEPGRLIFAEGERGHHAFLVESGSVLIRRRGSGGERVLGRIAAGGIFGEMALIDEAPRMASAIAESETACILLPRALLQEKLAKADPILVALLRMFVASIRSLEHRLDGGAPSAEKDGAAVS